MDSYTGGLLECSSAVRQAADAVIDELTTAAVLTIGSMIPIASAVGAAMVCVTFLLTTSFFFSTPGITQRSSTGFPIISTLLGQFLLKDIVLLAASFTLLLASVSL